MHRRILTAVFDLGDASSQNGWYPGRMIRVAHESDLAVINRIAASAFMTWDLPEWVKRLSLPSYLFRELDLQHLGIVVSEEKGELTGVEAWEPAEKQDCPADATGLLMHGLYVAPAKKAQDIGRQLLRRAETAAIDAGFDGVPAPKCRS